MAQRPVFKIKSTNPFYSCRTVDFVYNGGFAISQKQKNIIAIHEAYHKTDPSANILEISSKSMQEVGVKLSAFNLLKYVPSINKAIPVENVFQGGKVFAIDGPFTDLYSVTPKEAKRDARLKQSGRLTDFFFEGNKFPITPKTAFYDWIYINAILENEKLVEELITYDAFTDVEFNPEKSLNCQARAAAIFVSLYNTGKIQTVKDFDAFIEMY